MAESTFNSLDDVRAEMDAIARLFDDDTFRAELESSITDFEYQGLNVLALANQIMRRAKAANVDDAKKDIVSMILLFLCRGNNVDKMVSRTTDKGKARIMSFKTIYGLVNNVGRGGNTVLTLSRVAAVFPLITIRLLSMSDLNIPRAVLLPTTDFGEKFPKTMQTVIAAALFPRSALGKDLMRALLLYLIEENKLLGQDKTGDDAMILAKIIPYARASHVSSIFPVGKRNQVCKSNTYEKSRKGCTATKFLQRNTLEHLITVLKDETMLDTQHTVATMGNNLILVVQCAAKIQVEVIIL